MRTCVENEENLSREAVVVVIDDDASCRAVLKELFESVGLKVKLYTSGFAFLEDGVPDATSCLVIEVRLPARVASRFKRNCQRPLFTCRSFSSRAMQKSQRPFAR